MTAFRWIATIVVVLCVALGGGSVHALDNETEMTGGFVPVDLDPGSTGNSQYGTSCAGGEGSGSQQGTSDQPGQQGQQGSQPGSEGASGQQGQQGSEGTGGQQGASRVAREPAGSREPAG